MLVDFSMLEILGINNVVFEDELYHNGDVPVMVEKLCQYSHHIMYARINIAGALEHLAKADGFYRSDADERQTIA